MKWTMKDIEPQNGKIAIVTGANAGIGYHTAHGLAHAGAQVILACRDQGRGEAACRKIRQEHPNGSVELELLDLSRLESVREFAARIKDNYSRLDLLINNAGVMIPPEQKTAEGFELQFGVNFLAHFALTALLFERIASTENARIVTVSSIAHRRGRIDFESFRGEKKYRPWREYQQSKLACLIFATELQRRIDRKECEVISVAAHPGWTYTELQRHNGFLEFFTPLAAMPSAQGALPTLYAATVNSVKGGDYIGPDGWFEIRGYPAPAKISKAGNDPHLAKKLWEAASSFTGLTDWI